MASRLERGRNGRVRAVVITMPEPGLEVGARFLVLGDSLACGEPGFMWTGMRTGHRNWVTEPRRTNRDPLPVEAS